MTATSTDKAVENTITSSTTVTTDRGRYVVYDGITVAQPIEQQYPNGVHLKPKDELKKAVSSLDGAYFTLGHPDTDSRMVESVEQVRGYWRNPRYDDGLVADLHIPADDSEAQRHVEKHGDVSIGFRHRYASPESYDGAIGARLSENVDMFQTDLLIDHVASVEAGRCSGEDGCGLDSRRDVPQPNSPWE